MNGDGSLSPKSRDSVVRRVDLGFVLGPFQGISCGLFVSGCFLGSAAAGSGVVALQLTFSWLRSSNWCTFCLVGNMDCVYAGQPSN